VSDPFGPVPEAFRVAVIEADQDTEKAFDPRCWRAEYGHIWRAAQAALQPAAPAGEERCACCMKRECSCEGRLLVGVRSIPRSASGQAKGEE